MIDFLFQNERFSLELGGCVPAGRSGVSGHLKVDIRAPEHCSNELPRMWSGDVLFLYCEPYCQVH